MYRYKINIKNFDGYSNGAPRKLVCESKAKLSGKDVLNKINNYLEEKYDTSANSADIVLENSVDDDDITDTDPGYYRPSPASKPSPRKTPIEREREAEAKRRASHSLKDAPTSEFYGGPNAPGPLETVRNSIVNKIDTVGSYKILKNIEGYIARLKMKTHPEDWDPGSF